MRKLIEKFVIEKINSLSAEFPNISFTYGYDSIGKQHIVAIEPYSEYKNDGYSLAEFNVVDEFINQFPEDEIVFISNNKHIKIINKVYVKESYSFEGLTNLSKEMFNMEVGAFLFNPYLSKSLEIYQQEIFSIHLPFTNGIYVPTILDNFIVINSELHSNRLLFTVDNELNIIGHMEQAIGENNYAMAA